jgi:hypothetical protein
MAPRPSVGPWPLFQFRNPILGRIPWTGDQPVARPLPTHKTTQTQNKRTHTSMPRVGFEPTTPAFEQASDSASTVIGKQTLQFSRKSQGMTNVYPIKKKLLRCRLVNSFYMYRCWEWQLWCLTAFETASSKRNDLQLGTAHLPASVQWRARKTQDRRAKSEVYVL